MFCDVDLETYCIDPTKIEALITDKTVAICPVHVYGNMCDVETIDAIAKKHNLKVIYDAAHAFAVKYKGQSSASFGDMASVNDHSEFTYERLIKGFPYVNEENFLNFLNDVIEKYHIDCVYPAHDSVSTFLSNHSDEIKAQVIITDKFTTNICRSKAETYNYLRNEDFIPKIYENINNICSFPVFVKPVVGQGSQGTRKITSLDDLLLLKDEWKSVVVCEYLPGMEYTIDCFTDKNGHLLVAHARDRQRIKAGIAVRTESMGEEPEINRIANIINKNFRFKGAWFFQLKKNAEGKYRLLEISPRIPGTMGLSRNLGINFPMLTLFTFWGYDVDVIDNSYNILLDRAFYSAYKIDYEYDTVYLDFDDTLIIDNKVNKQIIEFMYQCSNKNIALVLLSKHDNDIYEDLRKYKICKDVFDKIVVISKEDEKYNYIDNKKSIFIDDSFSERKKVHEKCSIPVFDVDMVESLIDYRI